MLGSEVSGVPGEGARVFASDLMRDFGGVYSHRTGCRAQAVSGAGLVSVVFELFLEAFEEIGIGSGAAQFFEFSQQGDSGSGGQCEPVRHAVRLAESTFYTFVGLSKCGLGFRRRSRFRADDRQALETLVKCHEENPVGFDDDENF